MDQSENLTSRERLILAGIAELEKHGLHNFSIRRVATASGMSCAAPYKHFEDKRDFIAAIIYYVNDRWRELSREIAKGFAGDTRRQLVEISLGYIRFLHDNPHFRAIMLLRDTGLEKDGSRRILNLDRGSRRLVDRYCKEVNMTPEVRKRKSFVIYSLIYGAIMMLDNGEFPYEESMKMVEELIIREFEQD